MTFFDRFLIGALLPLAAVAHYVTPYEVVTKLMAIPSAILAAMFPAFAATFASDRERMAQLYDRAARTVVLATFPVILVAITLAHDGMRLWMGSALPPESATVLQWLALGVFINAIAQAPFAALQGAGRPDLIAKLHLIELPLYAALIWVLARSIGLTGVAIAWTLRVTVDATALLLVARRMLHLPLVPQLGRGWAVPLMIAAFGGGALAMNAGVRIAYVIVVGAVFAMTGWRQMLTASERDALLGWLRSPRAAIAPTPESIA